MLASARRKIERLRRAREARPWRPSIARLYARQLRRRLFGAAEPPSDVEVLAAATGWLARAHDATDDGGVAGRFRLAEGWTSSYPETTGYLVPTFLVLDRDSEAGEWRERARRCVEFLLDVQLDAGAFPGGEIAENRTRPSVFNTAQIVAGLDAWHRRTGDGKALAAAARATDWLVGVQDDDGAWRRHVYGAPAAYAAYAARRIAELGARTGEGRWATAAERHLDWVLARYEAGPAWFARSGFPDQHGTDATYTHTLGYTLDGVLSLGAALGREDATQAVRTAALRLARLCRGAGRVPGVILPEWESGARWSCLTGNAQLALVWLELHGQERSDEALAAARLALDGVAVAQIRDTGEPNLDGGVAGSDPVWEDYLPNALPNWAAKFLVDALLLWRRTTA